MIRELHRSAMAAWVLLLLVSTFAWAQTFPVLRSEKLLKKGRLVQPPTDAPDMVTYLRALAVRAGVEPEGSYLTFPRATDEAAPKAGRKLRPAFDLLAEAITGKGIWLEIPGDGRWNLSYSDDPARRISYAASGGLMTRIDYFSRREETASIWTSAMPLYDKDLAKDVVATRMHMEVLEAVSSKGVKYPAEKLAKTRGGKSPWVNGQQTIYLDKVDFPGDRIARLRVRGQVALRTGPAVFEFKTLGHKKPVTLMQSGVTVTVSPLTAIKRLGKEVWQLPVEVRTSYEAPHELVTYGDTISMFATDGKVFHNFSRSGSHGKNLYKMRIRIKPHSIDPSSTRMVIEYPTGLKVVPYELTFTDVRIKDVPPRKAKP